MIMFKKYLSTFSFVVLALNKLSLEKLETKHKNGSEWRAERPMSSSELRWVNDERKCS